MKKYELYISFFSKKLKVRVEAENKEEAMKIARGKLILDKVERVDNNDIIHSTIDHLKTLDDLKNMFGMK